jgi:hypothetical protein
MTGGLATPVPPTIHPTVARASPETRRCLAVVPCFKSRVLRRGNGASPVALRMYERTVGDTVPIITPKTARFVPICAMENIGMEDDWEVAQRIFILSGVPKETRVSTENNEES